MRVKRVKAYKGFNKNMTCRGFQFKEGETYEEDKAELCETGFHACERPLDVLGYYPPGSSVYHAVELEDVSEERSDDSKIVGKRIKIGAALSIRDLVHAHVEFVREHCTNETNAEPGKPATAGDRGAATAGKYGAATAGKYGAATAGEYGAATAGKYGAATAGDRGAATAGYAGAATAGDRGAATAGEYGAATAGEYGAATAGYAGAATAGEYGAATAGYAGAATAGYAGAATAGDRGAATAGEYGAATSRGSSSVGDNGIACARGNGCKVRGGIGAVLLIAEENERSYGLASWKAVVVDGETVKADTWYTLCDGKLVEVADEG